MNICEFSIKIINKNKHKTSIKEASKEAFWNEHGNEEKYNELVNTFHKEIGENFRAYCTIPLIAGYRKINESHCIIALDDKNDSTKQVNAKIIIVTKDNLTQALEKCQKEVKKILNKEGLKVIIENEKIKLFVVENNDKADVKVEIEASYKKREYFDFNDGIYLSVHLFFIFVSSILAFKYSDNSDIFPLSVTTAISLSISAIITTSIKLFGKRKIRIDDFTQWMKPSSEGEREMQELIKTRKLNTPKT